MCTYAECNIKIRVGVQALNVSLVVVSTALLRICFTSQWKWTRRVLFSSEFLVFPGSIIFRAFYSWIQIEKVVLQDCNGIVYTLHTYCTVRIMCGPRVGDLFFFLYVRPNPRYGIAGQIIVLGEGRRIRGDGMRLKRQMNHFIIPILFRRRVRCRTEGK